MKQDVEGPPGEARSSQQCSGKNPTPAITSVRPPGRVCPGRRSKKQGACHSRGSYQNGSTHEGLQLVGQEKHLPAWAVTVPGTSLCSLLPSWPKAAGACLQEALLGWTRSEGSPKQLAFILPRLEVAGTGPGSLLLEGPICHPACLGRGTGLHSGNLGCSRDAPMGARPSF